MGVGYCCMDAVCVVGKYPFVNSKIPVAEFALCGGGPAATALVTLSRMGARVCFVGKAGGDEYGRRIVRELEKENVRTQFIRRERSASSAFAVCIVEKNTGLRTIFYHRGKLLELQKKEVPRRTVASSKFLLLDGHNVEAGLAAAKSARQNNVPVSLDAGEDKPGEENLLRVADVIVIPCRIAQKYTHEKSAQKSAEKIYRKYHAKIVAVTQGEKGCAVACDEGVFTQRAYKVTVKDTTGAGDVFHGALVFGLLKGWNARKAVSFACAAAALKCREYGGRAGIPRLAEAMRFMEQGM